MAIAFESVSACEVDNGSIDCSPPSGIVDDDLLLAFAFAKNGLITAIVEPSGWTSVEEWEHANGLPFSGWFFKKASGESGNYAWDFTGSSANSRFVWMARISGADTTTPINIRGRVERNDTSAPINGVCPDITTTVDGCLIIRAGSSADGVQDPGCAITGVTATERVDAAPTPGQDGVHCMYTEDTIQASAGATGTATITMTGANPKFIGDALTIAIAPALVTAGELLTSTLIASISNPTGAFGALLSTAVVTVVTGSGTRWGAIGSATLLENV